MARCAAKTRRGGRCQRKAAPGERRCGTHLRATHAAYTPELAEQLVSLLRAGNHIAAAARAVGISEQTFRVWMRRGGAGDNPYVGFRERVEHARGQAEVRHVTQVAQAASEDWRAATWMLERQLRQAADDDAEPIDTAALAELAEAGARAEAEATLQAIGEEVELSVGAIDRYALAVASWRTLEAQWAQLGRPATTLGGATGTAQVPHPLIAQVAVARREAALLGGVLGLDPRGRHVLSRRVGAGRPAGAASAPDRVAAAPPRRQLRAVE